MKRKFESKFNRSNVLAALMMAAAPSASLAATYYWDGADTTDAAPNSVNSAQGGAGTWNTTASNTNWWDGNSNATKDNYAWANAPVSDAVFGTAGGAVLLGTSSLTVGDLSIQSTGYSFTLNGDRTLSFTSLSGANFGSLVVQPSTAANRIVTLTTASTTNTNWSGKLTNNSTGQLSLTKAGNGTVVLSNTSNDYAGKTRITAGSISFSDFAVLGTNSLVELAGGTASGLTYTGTGVETSKQLNLTEATTGGKLEQAGTGLLKYTADLSLTGVGAKPLVLTGSTAGTGEFAGDIVDRADSAISVTKSGTGTWTLSGTNSFRGQTTINGGGTLILSGSNSGAATTILNVGTLKLDNASNGGLGSGNLTLTNGTIEALNADRTIGNTISAFTASTDGDVKFAGNYSITLTAPIAMQTTEHYIQNNITTANNKKLILPSMSIALGSSNRTLNFTGTGNTQVVGAISHSGTTHRVTHSGSGILTLDGNNTYTGDTTVNGGGTLTINGTQDPTTGSNLLINGLGGTANLNSTNAMTKLRATVNASNAALNVNAVNALSGSAALSVTAGTATIGTSNNYTGTTIVNGGTLNLNAAGAISGSAISYTSGTINQNAANALSGTTAITVNGAAVVLSLPLANAHSGNTLFSLGAAVLGDKASLGVSNVTLVGGGASTFDLSASNDLTGDNKIMNTASLNGPLVVSGTKSIEWGGTITESNNRSITNTITTPGKMLTLSGTVNLSPSAANYTLLLDGPGTTVLSGLVRNVDPALGFTNTASKLAYQGTGLLELASTFQYNAGDFGVGVTNADSTAMMRSGASIISSGNFGVGNGAGDNAYFTQEGGSVNLAGAIGLVISTSTGSGTYEISGGTLNAKGINLNPDGVSTATLKVIGDAASIDLFSSSASTPEVLYTQGNGGILDEVITGETQTLIDITGTSGTKQAAFLEGSILKLSLGDGYIPTVENQTYDLLTAADIVDSGLTLAASSAADWTFSIVPGGRGEVLRATYIGEIAAVPEPGTVGVFGAIGAGFLLRRKRSRKD